MTNTDPATPDLPDRDHDGRPDVADNDDDDRVNPNPDNPRSDRDAEDEARKGFTDPNADDDDQTPPRNP